MSYADNPDPYAAPTYGFAADAAADAHREGRGRVDPSAWSEKGRSDFVTEVDVEAERRIVGIIRCKFSRSVGFITLCASHEPINTAAGKLSPTCLRYHCVNAPPML